MKKEQNLMDNFRVVSLAEVENKIISAIELTETDDKMGEQSPVWNKVYEALEELRKCSYLDYMPDA